MIMLMLEFGMICSQQQIESTFFRDLSDAVVALVCYKKLPTGMNADALGLVEPGCVPISINRPWRGVT